MRPIVSLLLVLALAACGGEAPAKPTTHDITGTFSLTDSDGVTVARNGSCSGNGGYSDIDQGAQITARDEDSTLIGTATLSAGAPNSGRTTCSFSFNFEELPDADFYTFELGRRGDLTYSRAEMEQADWTLFFTLGD